MTTTKIPSFLDQALLLRQATPFQGWLKGKHDATAGAALEQILRPQGTPSTLQQISRKDSPQGMVPPSSLLPLQDMDQAAVELVSLCFGTLLNSAFSGLEMGEGPGGEIWRSMLVEQYGKLLAESPVGKDLRDTIRLQVSQQEGKAPVPNDEHRGGAP